MKIIKQGSPWHTTILPFTANGPQDDTMLGLFWS